MIAHSTSGQKPGPHRLAPPALRGAAVACLTGEVACTSDKIRALYAWWRETGHDMPPSWSRFDVTEHRHVVAHLFLVKRKAPGEWLFTLKGEAVQALLPSGPLPEAIADLADKETSARLTAHYEEVARTGRCHLVRATLANDRGDVFEIESIDCPFIGGAAGGTTILGMLECVAVRPGHGPTF